MCLSEVRLKLACLRINLYYESLDSIQCTSYFYNLLYVSNVASKDYGHFEWHSCSLHIQFSLYPRFSVLVTWKHDWVPGRVCHNIFMNIIVGFFFLEVLCFNSVFRGMWHLVDSQGTLGHSLKESIQSVIKMGLHQYQSKMSCRKK